MAANTSVEAFAPASMGNVGVGFDVLGLAFEGPGDIAILEHREMPGAIILTAEGAKDIPLDGMGQRHIKNRVIFSMSYAGCMK